jgi:excisionase family DNA binding protein
MDQYISVDEAAEEMGVSRATIWKWIARQEMQTFRFVGDRRTFVRKEDIDQIRGPIPIPATKKAAA